VLEKQFGSICPIVISEVTYHLVACILTIQSKDTFIKHFNPHQFGVTIHGGCQIVVHSVQVVLDLHLDSVVL
jgi:hypothetical protein